MKLAARLAVLVLVAARLLSEPVSDSQAFAAPADTVATNVEQWTICTVEPCMTLNCCCWSTLYQEEHPEYPNPEIANRERKCIRGTLPDDFVLVKEPGYVGTNGQKEALMANQDPDFGVGRDLCCAVSKDDVTTQASHATMQEEVPVETTTPPPPIVNTDPSSEVPEEPPPVEEAPVELSEHLADESHNIEMHSGKFHGRNHTNTSNHSNHSNFSNASMVPEPPVEASLAHARRATDAAGSEFEKLEKDSDGAFDYRDLPRLQAEAAVVMVGRGHLRGAW